MTKETLIGILEDRAELQLQIGLSDKVYLDGIHLFCMGITDREIQVTEEAMYKIIEILQPTVEYSEFGRGHIEISFKMDLLGIPFEILALKKKEV